MSLISIGTLISMNADDGRDLSDWKAIAQRNGWQGDGDLTEAEAQPETPQAPTGDLEAFRLSNNRAVTYKRKPEHGGDLFMGEIAGLNGPGGVGKSTYARALCASTASGRPLLGKAIQRPRPTLYLNLEDVTAEVMLGFQAIAKYHRLSTAETRNLLAIGAEHLSGVSLTESDPKTGQVRVSQAGLEAVENLIKRAGAEVCVIDPLSMLLTAGQNDNAVVYPALQGLKKAAARNNCAILLVPHTKKGGTIDHDGAEATRGAGAITDAMRVVKGWRQVAADVCRTIGVPYGEEANIRELVDQKSNYTPAASGHYFQLVGVPMDNAQPPDYPEQDWVVVAVPFAPQVGGRQLPSQALRDAVVRLAQGSAAGAPYSPAKQGKDRYFGPDLEHAIKPHGTLNGRALGAAARDAFDTILGNGWVEIVPMPIGPNRRKGIRVIWGSTPWAADPPPPGPYQR